MSDKEQVSGSDEPTEHQVYKWFQESTITHHIEKDGSHISKRAMFVAKKAWQAAKVEAHLSPNKADVPIGWKLVPEEPTKEMLQAYWDFTRDTDEYSIPTDPFMVMIDAAPLPPKAPE